MKNYDEKIIVANTMVKYGGSFVKKLGEALHHADNINTIKIKNVFSEYWGQYLEMGFKDLERE